MCVCERERGGGGGEGGKGRKSNNIHEVLLIFAGLLIGIVCYRHYYPSVFSANCHIPHAACVSNSDSTELPLNSSRLNLKKEWH